MKKLISLLIGFLFCYSISFAGITKAPALVDTWTIVPVNATLLGANCSLATDYQTVLTVDVASVAATAQTNGVRIIVFGSTNTTTDSAWFPIATVNTLAGVTATANITWCDNNAANTSIYTNLTTGFQTKGMQFFINDSTQANAEICYVSNWTANAQVFTVWPLINTHVAGSVIYGANSTSSLVFAIPDSVYRIRVLYDNAQDAAGPAVAVRSKVSQLTGI